MEQFDFIVVGAGSAGCVLANKLSENPDNSVLLIEAGKKDSSPLIQMPRGFGKILAGTKLLWRYPLTKAAQWTQPETWMRGKTMGGSSSVNGMVYMRGLPADYDDMGLNGWAWKDIGPIFKAMEDHELGEAEWRGAGGPLKITLHSDHSPLCEAIITATEQIGVPRTQDVNAEVGESVGYQPRTIWRGKRQSAAKAFIDPIRSRRNLHIVTETDVLRVVFEGRRAIGVELRDKAGKRVVKAAREVILSAGALQSPKLLQLSGIGPAAHLASLGLNVVADAPEVGANLIEQRGLMPFYRVSHGSDNAELRGVNIVKNALKYALFGTGILTNAAFEVGALVKSRPGLDRPDSQISFGPYSVRLVGNTMMPEPEPGATFCCYILHPKSRGKLMIRSTDPDALPLIDPNYLDHEDDKRATIDLFRLTRKIFSQPALQAFAAREVHPGPAVQTDDEILAAFHEYGNTALHTVGTCRMGHDDKSVVDTQLRVRGVDGLRVADISVLPTIIAGNTNAPAMAIGWRASQLILGN